MSRIAPSLASKTGATRLGLTFIVIFGMPLNLGTLQGLQRFNWLAAITLLSAFLRLVLSMGFVLLGLGVNGTILSIVVSALLAYLVSFQPLQEILRGSRTSTGSLRSLWSYSVLAAVAVTGIVALYSIDTVLAGHFLSAPEVGLYAVSATTGRAVLFITSSVLTIMFPRVGGLHEGGAPLFRAGYSKGDIARLVGVNLQSIYRALEQEQPPYLSYLTKRWNEGCHLALQLHQEVVAQGYTGSARTDVPLPSFAAMGEN
jgi:hypothetical protein